MSNLVDLTFPVFVDPKLPITIVLKIPLSVYVGFPIAATVVLLLTPWNFESGINQPLAYYSAAIVLNALFFRRAVRLASGVLADEPKTERVKPKTKHGK